MTGQTLQKVGALLVAGMLGGCASVPGPSASAALPALAPAAKGGAAGPAVAAAPAPSPPSAAPQAAPGGMPSQPPFALVVRDAREISTGALRVWQRDDRVWIELAPGDFDQPLFLTARLSQGIGEADLYGGRVLSIPSVVTFRRVHGQVQLLATNTMQTARSGTPERRALEASTSPSLLGAVPVASQPHPERRSVLIDASALFGGDMLGLAGMLQRAYRQGYGMDGRNSGVVAVRGRPGLLVLETQSHFYAPALQLPVPGAPAGTPQPSVPRGVPDPRSLLLGVHYTLMRFPDAPMAGRRADPRVGHFVASHDDLTSDAPRTARVRWVQR